MKKLAIVIPAFKPDYLQETLASLAAQTDLRFTVYIGIDASPHNLEDIIKPFCCQLDLHCHRFEENLGSSNLVGQWERCIHLCQDEEWVCLFSDDDIMQTGCVAAFHQSDISREANILHYNIDIIDENNTTIIECPLFPEHIDNASYFDLLFRRKIVARMPEFVFKRSFLDHNGFIPFDLAWRSDTATILCASSHGGIQSLSGDNCKVLWRASTKNISGQERFNRRKNMASIAFFNWVYDNHIPIKMSRFYLLKTIVFSLEYSTLLCFFMDGCKAAIHLKFAKWHRLLCFLFVIYRIPYHYFELHRS